MNLDSLVRQRLFNQRLVGSSLHQPQDVVHWLGAAQAQDYAGAKWSLGLRLDPDSGNANDAAVEGAFNSGAILRTHVLRPTWHFVAPADIRWLLALTAPRVHMLNGPYYRRVDLDDDLYGKARRVLTSALRDGAYLTRDELRAALEAEGMSMAADLRMVYVLMRAELDGLLCSGPRRGRQFTYALLEERVPPAVSLTSEEALAELARRFFRSHGPATVNDLARWASLTLADARNAAAAVRAELESEAIGDQTYWFDPYSQQAAIQEPFVFLLSIYDEYTIGYKDWSPFASAEFGAKLQAMGNDLTAVLVLNGHVAGTWKRTIGKRQVTITIKPFDPLGGSELQAVAAAAERYGAFLGLPATVA